jgi:DNA-binding Xre family transcriptional regulator
MTTTRHWGRPPRSADDAATDREIGQVVQNACASRQVSRAELGRRTGIHQADVSRLLDGQKGWKVTQLLRVADALDIAPERLLPPA